MKQDDRDVPDPSEGLQGGEALAATLAGNAAGAEVGEQERVLEAENSVHGKAASEGTKKQDLEEPSLESGEVAEASGSVEIEERESFENTVAIATHFEFRSASVDMTRPFASLRGRSRGGKQAVGPMRFTVAGDAARAGSEAAVLGASSSSAPATGTHADVPATANVDQGPAPGDDIKLKRASFAPGARVAIMHASPPDSYRRVPWRSRKQYSPKRFVTDPSAPAASPGSALPSASASGPRTGISGVIDASASSSSNSNHPPSRGRKQPRPEHFIPEEAEATASAKARRSDIVLDRFLSSLVHGPQSSDSEWVTNVTAEDATVRGQQHSTVEGFRIRDASRLAARALSRLGCASPSEAPGSPPGEPDGRGRIYGVLAVLGASLALTVVTCVLVYIVGRRGEPGPSGEKPDE